MNTPSDKDKIIAVQEELIQKYKQENEELRQKIKEWEDWKASSKERHARGKAKADLAISKHKNTLRINTTREPKK